MSSCPPPRGSLVAPIRQPVNSLSSGGCLPVDADPLLTADSDTRVPSQKAVKSYVDALDTRLTGLYTDLAEILASSDPDLDTLQEVADAIRALQDAQVVFPIDVDPLLSADSDELVPSQKAVRAYIDVADGQLQGAIDLMLETLACSDPDLDTVQEIVERLKTHTHDDRYYTEGEIDTLLADTAADAWPSDTAPDPAEYPLWLNTRDLSLNRYYGTPPDGDWVNLSHPESGEVPAVEQYPIPAHEHAWADITVGKPTSFPNDDVTAATTDGATNPGKILKTDANGRVKVGALDATGSVTIGVTDQQGAFNGTALSQNQNYALPDDSGTMALTGDSLGRPDALYNATISGTCTINSTSYTFGSGAAAAMRDALDVPASDPTGITGADAISNIVSLTAAEYAAITPNSTTLYIVT